MDSSAITPEPRPAHRLEAWCVTLCLIILSCGLHAWSLFLPSQFIFSPSDILGRQTELGGSPLFEPSNRLLIDPLLQFETWDSFARQSLGNGQFPWWNPYNGAGAPFAGNGQSQLFDPVKFLFRILPAPWAWAAESALRFIVAGLGMYWLCRSWKASAVTRCWCALALPMTGFFTLWRLYPLVAAGGVIPWFLLAFERLSIRPSPIRFSLAALATAWLIVSGNVQIAAVGCIAVSLRCLLNLSIKQSGWSSASLIVGFLISAPAWGSLASYLIQSPIWADRIAEHSGQGRSASARWMDLPTLIAPYLYGSERRGDPNLHKALGAGNVNEAASGYIGLVSLLALIPAALIHPKIRRTPLLRYALCLWLTGLIIGYRLPPVAWVWPHLPILQGMDPRRFLIGMSLGGCILAGLGLQSLAQKGFQTIIAERWAIRIWLALAISFSLGASIPLLIQGKLEKQAIQHYENSVEAGPNHAELVKARVSQQMQSICQAWPAYMAGRSLLVLMLAGIFWTTPDQPSRRAAAVGLLALCELLHFGWFVNPHVSRDWFEKVPNPALIHRLKEVADSAQSSGFEARFLALGEALPPNQLMRFGLKDLRNYDSIELSRSFTSLKNLYNLKPGQDQTSRREIRWPGVQAAQDSLKNFGVIGVIGLTEPPSNLFDRVESPMEGVWIGLWKPQIRRASPSVTMISDEPGKIRIRMEKADKPVVIREMFDPGWRVSDSGSKEVNLQEDLGTGFIAVIAPEASLPLEVELCFRPVFWREMFYAMTIGVGLCCSVPTLFGIRQIKNRKKTFPPTEVGG
jgi:hypothetical protein